MICMENLDIGDLEIIWFTRVVDQAPYDLAISLVHVPETSGSYVHRRPPSPGSSAGNLLIRLANVIWFAWTELTMYRTRHTLLGIHN